MCKHHTITCPGPAQSTPPKTLTTPTVQLAPFLRPQSHSIYTCARLHLQDSVSKRLQATKRTPAKRSRGRSAPQDTSSHFRPSVSTQRTRERYFLHRHIERSESRTMHLHFPRSLSHFYLHIGMRLHTHNGVIKKCGPCHPQRIRRLTSAKHRQTVQERTAGPPSVNHCIAIHCNGFFFSETLQLQVLCNVT